MSESLTIQQIELYRLSIPLKEPFITSLGTETSAENVLVKIFTKEGIIGFGKSGDYLKFTEYGVKPSGQYPAYSKTPPASVFAEWIRRARLHIPDTFKSHALRARDRIRSLSRLGRNGSNASKRFSRIASLTMREQASKRKPFSGDEEARARLRWAWAMVIKRKRYGYRGLKVIERVVREQENAIRQILQGLS